MAWLIGGTIFLAGLTVNLAMVAAVSSEFTTQIDQVVVSGTANGRSADTVVSSDGSITSAEDESSAAPSAQGTGAQGVSITQSATAVATQLRTRVLRGALGWALVVQLILVVGSAALGWWLSGRLVARIGKVGALARAAASGDLSQRLRITGTRDEVTDLGEAFDEMLDRLEASFKAQQTFVANASHELRTPLASARLAIDAPRHQGLYEGPGLRGVTAAIAELDRAALLLDLLLELATSTYADLPDQTRVDVARCARDAIENHQVASMAKHQRFELDLSPASVDGSATLIGRGIDNLVSNAVRHAPAGSVITMTTAVCDDTVQIVLSNDGEVLPAQSVASLVRPFERGHHTRRSTVPGSGLGLSIVSSIVERHGGQLSLQARDEGGLVVLCTLPAAAPGGDPHRLRATRERSMPR